MTKNLSDWEPHILPHAQGLSRPSLVFHVRDAIDRFCRRSSVWRHEFTPINVVADTADYTASAPSGALVVRIIALRFAVNGDGKTLPAITAPLVDEETSPRPSGYIAGIGGAFTLWPTPTEAQTNGVDGEVALTVSDDATTVPDWLWDEWRREIAAGALSQILNIQGQRWTNPASAAAFARDFASGVANAYWQGQGQRTRSSVGVMRRPWV